MTAREWVRIDVGLLDDERFVELGAEERGVWTTIYLLLAREGDSAKDLDRLIFLLRRQGIPDPSLLVAALDSRGWFVEHSQGGVTLRGYEQRQIKWYRGPSDDPAAKAKRNADRPTTRAGRAARGATRSEGGASVEHRGATPPHPPVRHSTVGGATDDSLHSDPPKKFGEAMKEAGFDPASLKSKERTS